MGYYQLDPTTNTVNGAFALPQPGNPNYLELPDDDPRAVAWLNPAPVYSCQLWQLQSVMTDAQWTAAQQAVAGMKSPSVSAFWQHGTNSIPSTSATLIALGNAIGLTADQIVALVKQASTVAIT